MSNEEHQGLASLLHGGVDARIGSLSGGVWGGMYYAFYISIPAIQEYLTGGREDFDGVDEIDFPEFCGEGYTLEEAYRNFIENNSELTNMFSGLYGDYTCQEIVKMYAEKVIDELKVIDENSTN